MSSPSTDVETLMAAPLISQSSSGAELAKALPRAYWWWGSVDATSSSMGDLLIEKSGGTAINPAGFVAIYDADRAAVARHRRVVRAGPHDVQEPAVTPREG
ncbi:hypothetical protein [Dermacoccus sp. Ellin185]|uniref:hypothetical protein n=1 Tax=Dermacoccus sp. Ellin185 TaxID=188626 RepID=UPI0001E64391|nr:hypothetical protein [Dermacoccus sp. Ellin185]EFP59102.1 hypothetical protein HMPREF0321_0964 [Dermacoccus sp. Ellin185]